MYKPTLFSELLKLIPRNIVQDAALKFNSDSPKTTFKSWQHLVSMFSGVNSLRTLEQSLGSHTHSLYHLGKVDVAIISNFIPDTSARRRESTTQVNYRKNLYPFYNTSAIKFLIEMP